MRLALSVLLLVLSASGCATTDLPTNSPASTETLRSDVSELLRRCADRNCGFTVPRGTKVDTVLVDDEARHVTVQFSRELGETFWREAEASRFEGVVADAVSEAFPGYATVSLAVQNPVSALVPNAFRAAMPVDAARRARPDAERPAQWVRPADRPFAADRGLTGRHIAMWPSHGWYYEPKLDRWEWQRARAFTTVEDLLPFAFVNGYLAPMLERAGANVLLPRERDTQMNEVIVDNDSPGSGYVEMGQPWQESGPGFASRPPYGDGVNPFALGTHRTQTSGSRDLRMATWTPDFPEAGDYAVYVSYVSAPDRTDKATYRVRHSGGETAFLVNQQMGGGTWVYLGTFRFDAGTEGSVSLLGDSGGTMSADAVRFGGGMGVIERGGSTSGRPRFVEGARYYEQFAGAPPYVYNLTGAPDNDYRDDFASRGEWVNWLRAPTTGGGGFGPVGHRDAPGLGVPVDLSLAFHTDAGITRNDTTIGTLLIFHTPGLDGTGTLPDGVSRLANRDFADMLQTQLVDDIRAVYDPAWNRRGLWDRDYSEGARPNVPSALLELLSHQNYLDMAFALDPRFRFDASRAMYKAIGRFLADHHGTEFVVQPLAVTHLVAELVGDGSARLSWRPQSDPLEPSAEATEYIVYRARGGGGFDNGTLVDGTSFVAGPLAAGVVHRFRVSAVNDGGESAPSEEAAVGWTTDDQHEPVLVVNGFDRVAPPARVEEGNLLGFASYLDQGVPDGIDVGTIGDQYNFAQDQPWLDDDNTGHGSSNADFETKLIAGNTHNFAAVHGAAILAAERSFAYASDEAVWDGAVSLSGTEVIDLYLGEERTTPSPKPFRPADFEAFPQALREQLGAFRAAGGKLFVSGAYVGTDIAEGKPAEDPGVAFLADVLGIRWRTNHAATDGRVVSVSPELLERGAALAFNAARGPEMYAVEAPDGIEPASEDGRTVLRYAETSISAGVASPGSVVLGFPFEALTSESDRNALMVSVLRWLGSM